MASFASLPIRLLDYLIMNFSGKKGYLSFLHEVSHELKVASETTTFGCIRSVILSHQIAGFFYHQYLRKESIDILILLHGYNH